MNQCDLLAELLDAAEPTMIPTLWQLGISSRAVVRTGAVVGRQRVRSLRAASRLYEPSTDGNGIDALVVPVVEEGVLVDLVAVDLARPSRWWLRTGAGVVLGDHWIVRADWLDEPLVLFRVPIAWLRADCQGAMILDWRSAAWRLAGIRTIIADTLELAARLERALTGPPVDVVVRVKEVA